MPRIYKNAWTNFACIFKNRRVVLKTMAQKTTCISVYAGRADLSEIDAWADRLTGGNRSQLILKLVRRGVRKLRMKEEKHGKATTAGRREARRPHQYSDDAGRSVPTFVSGVVIAGTLSGSVCPSGLTEAPSAGWLPIQGQ